VSLTLDPDAVARIASPPDPHRAFVPPAPPPVQPKSPPPPKLAVQDATPPSPSRCGRCRNALPAGRTVNFCPECGYDLRRGYCPQCNAELEPDWRHCVSCGQALSRT
jgi:hypothetical protein